MTLIDWILVGSFLVGGIVLGNIFGRITNRALSSESRPQPIQDAAKPLSSLVLYGFVIAGLMSALGIVQPDALEEIPRDLIAFLPRVLSAAIIVIGANVVTSFVQAALRPMMGRSSARVQRQVNLVVKAFIVGLAVVLAVTQIGIDTTIINIVLAAVFFGLAASMTLLVGLGGQAVAKEVASSRAVRRLVNEGDQVSIGSLTGTVVAVRPTAVEIQDITGAIMLVPSSQFVGEPVTVTRAPSSS
ncbi:MAG: mechanosensitive ion channel [Acidimicrobiales bacterium]|nr:mechanosensitive ion channel [Acidimicrobiales bacterium]